MAIMKMALIVFLIKNKGVIMARRGKKPKRKPDNVYNRFLEKFFFITKQEIATQIGLTRQALHHWEKRDHGKFPLEDVEIVMELDNYYSSLYKEKLEKKIKLLSFNSRAKQKSPN